jgi:alpha-glucosidase
LAQAPYRFLKVEEYFGDLSSWTAVSAVGSRSYDATARELTLHLPTPTGSCVLLLTLLQKHTFRVRFNPGKAGAGDYPPQNSRSVVMDTYDELRTVLTAGDQYGVDVAETASGITLTTSAGGDPVMRIVVTDNPFGIAVHNLSAGVAAPVWQTALPALRYTPNGRDNFAIVQSSIRPPMASYVGFGEHGGKSLVKNNEQLTHLCFDNYLYNQVYGGGPLDEREPLYHSDPFFIELNGVPGADSVYGIFLDNLGQTFIDLGVLDSGRCLLGIRFGDLDYHVFLGGHAAEVLERFTAVVGRSRLKPRYALGYHQGCYGYEDRGALEWAARKYREHAIPLDGLHVDVDVQHDYQTFTIRTDRFPSPPEMFAGLRALGVKCSTNITPIVSNRDPGYSTYTDGRDKGYFVLDVRDVDDPQAHVYQQYGGGNPYTTFDPGPPVSSYNTGGPYIGEVNYGGSLGTTGHYPDLARKEVRQWWGARYQPLFDAGLEMVWQDMTTPAIRDTRGDMKGFPFRMVLDADPLSGGPMLRIEAVKVWNLYSYNLHKATYHGLNNLASRGDRRNFIVGRGSFTGMHRFAALWTGDNASTWDFLRINIAQVLAIGLCGQAMAGEDIGGFAQGEPGQGWVGPELLMRWTMAGAFLPWFRNHYVRKGQKQFQEPFQYVEWFRTYNQPVPDPALYDMVVPVCRHYIERRYRLLQLFYDAMVENTLTGLPICRPLFLTDPQDRTLYGSTASYLDTEFCVGADMLVAPILDPQTAGRGRRDVYLPAGSDWYCDMDDRLPLDHPVPGGTTVRDFDASLGADGDHIAFLVPVYVRAGAVIPTLPVEQYVGERREKRLPHPLTLTVYPGRSGSHTLHLDDGVSRASAPKRPLEQGGDEKANDEYRQVLVSHSSTGARTREIRIQRVHDGYTPPEDSFRVAVLHDPGESRGPNGPLTGVAVNGTGIDPLGGATPAARAAALEAATADAWYYDETLNRSVIKVLDTAAVISVVVTNAA